MKALIRWLGTITGVVMGVMLFLMTIVVFLQVFYRYCLMHPLTWAEEAARFLFIWMALLGAALGVKDRAHFAITMVSDRLPHPVHKALNVVFAVGASLVFYVMIVEGAGLVRMNMNQESPAIGVPMGIPYLAIPVSGLLMLIFAWYDLAIHWHGNPSSASAEEGMPRTMTLE